MKSKVSGINSLVLVLVAFSSLLSMFALTRIDSIVHQDLYRYGLKFSYEWAMTYWTMTTLIFAMGWFNIIIACAFQFYVLLYGRRKEEVIPQKEALKPVTAPQRPIEEKPIEAEKEKVEEPKLQEMKPAETAEAETKETIASPMEVELETWRDEEAQKPAEEPKEEPVTVVEEKGEETMPQEYIETEPKPEERFEEPQEPVDVQLQEETSYAEEEEREQEEMPRETVETETQETPPPAPEREEETTESEETQTQTLVPTEEHETPTEETQQRESELTEPYPT